MNDKLKKQLAIGTFWSLVGRVGYLIVSLVTNIILARMLGPKAFGQIGIIMFFIIIARVLTESGLSGALIRKKEVSDEDYSTVFIFNLFVSIILFLLIVISAKFIAQFYDDIFLKKLLTATSLVIIINAFQIVNNAKLIHSLNYRKKSIIEFIALLVASTCGIIAAAKFDVGVWAVVTVQLLTALLITIQLWVHLGFLKKVVFSVDSFKSLYKFGLYTTLASLLNTAFDNVYQLILGKYFAIQQTGLFYQAKKLQEVPVGVIQSTTLGVIFASLAKVQDDLEQFSRMYNRIVTLFTIAVGFICLFIFFYAENIILLLYGEEWIGAVFFMQILIVASFFFMQEMFNRIIFKIFDRTEKILFLEIIKKTFQAITILIGILMRRIDMLLYGFLLTSILSYFINYYYSRKVFGHFSWFEILTVLKIALIGALTVGIGTCLEKVLQLDRLSSFILMPILFLNYLGMVRITKIANILETLVSIKEQTKRETNDKKNN
ncbi:lipopolysaccharide biosynthesis protein [Sunxiuqinia dokdonensis]|uniref:Polysaccharide biosynthesis protein C-terminal domain-containing protein n=1 Tax=Sunxiuqinia dokdonensis TaxID=1409788 RepID=A0A0L8VF51_9BACT|nr:lipopolysaccharide biosynthesis protein [Sunxiuqinia dokdonensis]KOH47100.1 hypothetical protein NC99_00660 [Sunxiuqinia dokdonensis]